MGFTNYTIEHAQFEFSMFMLNQYKDPYRAVLREYVSNAMDAVFNRYPLLDQYIRLHSESKPPQELLLDTIDYINAMDMMASSHERWSISSTTKCFRFGSM